MGDLRWVAEAARYSAPAFVFEGVEGVGPSTNFGAVFEDTFNKLFGDGTTADLFEVFNLGKELAATGEKLSRRGSLHV